MAATYRPPQLFVVTVRVHAPLKKKPGCLSEKPKDVKVLVELHPDMSQDSLNSAVTQLLQANGYGIVGAVRNERAEHLHLCLRAGMLTMDAVWQARIEKDRFIIDMDGLDCVDATLRVCELWGLERTVIDAGCARIKPPFLAYVRTFPPAVIRAALQRGMPLSKLLDPVAVPQYMQQLPVSDKRPSAAATTKPSRTRTSVTAGVVPTDRYEDGRVPRPVQFSSATQPMPAKGILKRTDAASATAAAVKTPAAGRAARVDTDEDTDGEDLSDYEEEDEDAGSHQSGESYASTSSGSGEDNE